MNTKDYFIIATVALINGYFLFDAIFQIIDLIKLSSKRNRDEFEKLIEENEKRMRGYIPEKDYDLEVDEDDDYDIKEDE